VINQRDSVEIVLENRGRAAMPVRLSISRINGRVDRLTVPAEVWLAGERRRTVRVAREPMVRNIEVDTEKDFPDLDRSNQVWPR
jgi:hypothetical protein